MHTDANHGRQAYHQPAITDHGNLGDLTLACQGSGAEDGAMKDNAPFLFSQPDFGNPGFCA